MAGTSIIPERISHYNVYILADQGLEKLVGVADISMPSLDPLTQTVSGPGILGEFESGSTGAFGSMELEITFRVLHEKNFAIFANSELVLRASQQSRNTKTGKVEDIPLKIHTRYLPKAFGLGSLAPNTELGASYTLELTYIHIMVNNKSLFELDKLNNVFRVDGVDQMAKINAQI